MKMAIDGILEKYALTFGDGDDSSSVLMVEKMTANDKKIKTPPVNSTLWYCGTVEFLEASHFFQKLN